MPDNYKVLVICSGCTDRARVISALKPAELPYLILGGFLEGIAYIQAKLQVNKGPIPYAWEPISSTKN